MYDRRLQLTASCTIVAVDVGVDLAHAKARAYLDHVERLHSSRHAAKISIGLEDWQPLRSVAVLSLTLPAFGFLNASRRMWFAFDSATCT